MTQKHLVQNGVVFTDMGSGAEDRRGILLHPAGVPEKPLTLTFVTFSHFHLNTTSQKVARTPLPFALIFFQGIMQGEKGSHLGVYVYFGI